MSALAANAIRARLRHDAPERRLVVSPLLDPLIQVSDSQAGIDVRLGRVFSIARPWATRVGEYIDPDGASPSSSLETFILAFGQPLIIHPHQFVLGRTLELVRMPSDLVSYVIGRSSWGRRGLIVATAVVVHPGFSGPIILELRNLGETPIALYPMDRIAQLVFHTLDDATSSGQAAAPGASIGSQFLATFEPSMGKVRRHEEAERLAAMAQKLRPERKRDAR